MDKIEALIILNIVAKLGDAISTKINLYYNEGYESNPLIRETISLIGVDEAIILHTSIVIVSLLAFQIIQNSLMNKTKGYRPYCETVVITTLTVILVATCWVVITNILVFLN